MVTIGQAQYETTSNRKRSKSTYEEDDNNDTENTPNKNQKHDNANTSLYANDKKIGVMSILDSILSLRAYVPPHQITNVVSTFRLGCPDIDLVKLTQEFDFITYNPSKFAAGKIRNRTPKVTFLIFRTGTAICAGAKTIQEARYGAQLMCNFFMELGKPFVMTDFSVRNVVGIMWCPFRLCLNKIYSTNMVESNVECSYSPDVFPGLIMRIADPKSVSLVFQTGKVVCTGANNQEGVECAFEYAYTNILRHYADRSGSSEDGFVEQFPKLPGQKGAELNNLIMNPEDARKALEKERATARKNTSSGAESRTPKKNTEYMRLNPLLNVDRM